MIARLQQKIVCPALVPISQRDEEDRKPQRLSFPGERWIFSGWVNAKPAGGGVEGFLWGVVIVFFSCW